MTSNPIDGAKGALRRLKHSLQPSLPKQERAVKTRADFVSCCHRMDYPPLRMVIPLDKIRIQGARPIDQTHPFVAAIEHGPAQLTEFYSTFQPADLAAMYGIEKSGRDGEELPPWELPWMGRDMRSPPPGEAGLDAAHGVSFYGPGTAEKVAVEHQRLISAKQSIAQYGFDPERYGDIEGYGLVSQHDFRFFVRGGKHRLAALASLGWTDIPVSFRAHWPTAIYGASVDDWPLVAQRAIAPQFAHDIFERYF